MSSCCAEGTPAPPSPCCGSQKRRIDWLLWVSLALATLLGLVLTLIATTVIVVCSEGSSPIAADLLTRAAAPGGRSLFSMLTLSEALQEWLDLCVAAPNFRERCTLSS